MLWIFIINIAMWMLWILIITALWKVEASDFAGVGKVLDKRGREKDGGLGHLIRDKLYKYLPFK